MIKCLTTGTCALGLLAAPLAADEAGDAMSHYAAEKAAEWLQSDAVIAAINSQNARTADLSAEEIDGLDKNWRAQVGQVDAPLISSVMGNPLSVYLTNHVAEAGGLITEMFVMDAQGLNVAASSVTSDYWQGDEAKFQQTFGVGPQAMHVSEVELDESTQTYQAQVSLSLTDPATGNVIGAVTFGLNAQAFF
jgi:hypothetical protein